jgi:diamine N-acetyltransferase
MSQTEGSMTINLRPITAENWEQSVQLQVKPEQTQYVAPNVFSLAQAAYDHDCTPLAIYDDEVMVGFAMYWHPPGEPHYFVNRLMIDATHQQKGYGRTAMEQLLAQLMSSPDCREIGISYHPQNIAAQRMYASLGFHETGETRHGEVVALLPVRRVDA